MWSISESRNTAFRRNRVIGSANTGPSLGIMSVGSAFVFFADARGWLRQPMPGELAVESLTHPERYPPVSQAQPNKPLQPTGGARVR